MPRGRRPLPTETLKARGAFDRHPERAAAREAIPKATGDAVIPPRFLKADSPTAQEKLSIWKETVALFAAGHFNVTHSHVLEVYCDLMYLQRRNQASSSDRTRIGQLQGIMGMNNFIGAKVTKHLAGDEPTTIHEHEDDTFAALKAKRAVPRPN